MIGPWIFIEGTDILSCNLNGTTAMQLDVATEIFCITVANTILSKDITTNILETKYSKMLNSLIGYQPNGSCFHIPMLQVKIGSTLT